MNYQEKYVRRNKMYGDGLREVVINTTKRRIESSFKDSESYYNVKYLPFNGNVGDEIDLDVQIVDKSDIRDEKLLTTFYDTPFTSGGIVDWKNDKWMVTLTDEMSDIYRRGAIRRCATSLKWIDDEGKLIEEWISFKMDSPANFGLEERKIILFPNERRQLMLRLNDDTRKINKNQRFILDGRAWSVMSIDRLSVDNIMYLVLDEDQNVLPDDNLELGVANYYSRLKNYSIRILNEKSQMKLGTPYQIIAELYDGDTKVDNASFGFRSSDELILVVDQNGQVTPQDIGFASVYIECKGLSLELKLEVVNDMNVQYLIIMETEPSMYINEIKTFSFHCEANGVSVALNTEFEVTARDGSSTDLATIQNRNGNSCSIKANKKMGYFLLKVWNVEHSIEKTYEIKVKSII